MQQTNRTLVTFALLCALCTTAMQAQDVVKANAILLKATGPFEDMIAPALAKNEKGMARHLAAADQQAKDVQRVLPAESAKQFETLLQSIHKAADGKDDLVVAEKAAVVFRLLIDNLKAGALKIPVEVSLLDWAAYELQVLAAAEKPDWSAMTRVATEAAGWWNGIAKRVGDKNLRATVTTTIHGLQQSTSEQNLSMLKFAAQVALDVVDLLEVSFKK